MRQVVATEELSVMAVRIFLGLIGSIYCGLGIWCAAAPEKTSRTVGFSLQPGAGQSEFLTVYGGLEVALGLAFLWPLWRPDQTQSSLGLCLIVHACLVAFRTLGFLLYENIPGTTKTFAAFEWAILLVTAAFWWFRKS